MNAPSPEPIHTGATIPRATYRLQLHRGFDFDAARAVLPYLARLGVSHVYCSPIASARPGSTHGYDMTDPARINPELGGREGFERFAAAARALGLGLLLDQVPNHMGVAGAGNDWWNDVLENGRASPFAGHFDIDWQPPNPALAGKLLLPVLGEPYGDVLERGELRLHVDATRGALAFGYFEHRFPLDPATYATVLHGAAHPTLQTLATAFAALPGRDGGDAAEHATRRTSQRALQAALAQAAAGDASVAAAIEAHLEHLAAPPQRDALDALHDAQAYRLAHWRSAAEDINYRRFFDINELAALRIEDERVFEAVMGPALDLTAAGLADGLRIDHPDGLLDPAAFFERLQRGHARRVAPDSADEAATTRPLYVVAEKIAAGFEDVPPQWAVHGTTGYRFAMLVGGLFVERRHAQRMERLWRTHADDPADFADTVFESKRLIAGTSLRAQLTALAHALQRIALADRASRDHGLEALRNALADVAAGLPVYRTYLGPDGAASAQDVRFVDWAIAQAKRRGDPADAALFAFVRAGLLGQPGPRATPEIAAQVRAFALRFQQFSAPVAAKGVEDTAFYRYHRLVALNEVGGDPAVFGISAAAFHGASASRAADWPHTMLATSTHDNKRAEDVRLRLAALSEQPAAWRLALARWRTATRPWRTVVEGIEAPSRADQFLLHQTLLGTLPAEGLNADTLPAYRERIEAYALKAAREAKRRTSWTRPNADYERALAAFVAKLLGRVDANPVLADLQQRASVLAAHGALSSLAMTLLKFTSPGVPDIYQGTELIDLSLVDPDNRRAVDFAPRAALLAEFEALAARPEALDATLSEWAAQPATDGRLKLWIAWRLLVLRRAQPAFFASAAYVPLRVRGARRRHAIGFARQTRDATLVVACGRKFSGLAAAVGAGMPIGDAAWGDTAMAWPARLGPLGAGTEWLSGRAWAAGADGSIDLAPLFATLPMAALWLPR
ncbi:MAG TPA: malto-oligosyltrehalose synthase [Burkholderiaceae bacterium]|nr:malto-oligosyltrehalose synthase [Burkholderiaceae bacterium]